MFDAQPTVVLALTLIHVDYVLVDMSSKLSPWVKD